MRFFSSYQTLAKKIAFFFFFFLSQGFQSTTKSSLNEWNYLTTLGNERADWEAVIWMKFLQSILLVVFKPRVDTQIPISPGRNTCKTAPRTQCSFKPWIIKLFLYLVYLFQGLNNLEAHNYSSLFQLMFRKRIKCFVQKSHRHFAAVLELNWALPASNLVPTGWNLADSIACSHFSPSLLCFDLFLDYWGKTKIYVQTKPKIWFNTKPTELSQSFLK